MRRPLVMVMGWMAFCLAGGADQLEDRLLLAEGNRSEIEGFLKDAAAVGPLGGKAARTLVGSMPAADLRTLKRDFLMENLRFALKAREEFPWAKGVPEEVFLNDVLPYASLDETRERWRPGFYERSARIVKGSETATEAVQALNREFFKEYGVHYNTGRKRPNQSPSESKELGMATCTGLSIILVDACRSVGIPARVAGTALWANKRGNHTWVEVYAEGEWHFTGADEHDAKGLNRAWFTGDASKAVAEDWRHAIWATSWKKDEAHFPMVWDLANKDVGAVNVTGRYAREEVKPEAVVPVHLRVLAEPGGERIVVEVEWDGKRVLTKAGTADMNDMATLGLQKGEAQRLILRYGGEERALVLTAEQETTKELIWSELEKKASGATMAEVRAWLALLPEERHLSVPEGALTDEEAALVSGELFEVLKKELAVGREGELARRKATEDGTVLFGVVKAAGKEMKLLEKTFGQAPEGGHSLWISMHGGGGAPARVNEGQWKNQIALYQPEEGIYVAPRAPTDTWNLWHEGHIDDLLDRTIENYVVSRGVDPDRVYLMGYSAGGDGVYQLAPRMADRFAAASMMAGHPNDASPLGLRNLPFMIWMGENDGAYKRNEVAKAWGEKLGVLEQGDAGGYVHQTHLVKGKGHWMDRADAAALPWMVKHERKAWPKKLVWHQSGRTHERFYWLAVGKDAARKGQTVRAEVEGQRISVTSDDLEGLTLRLSDELVDLNEELVVVWNGKEAFRGRVGRSTAAIFQSLQERLDVGTVATAELKLGS